MGVKYFIGAGDIYVAQLDPNFNPLDFRNVGEAPVFEFDPTVEYADNFATNKLAPNLQDLHIPIKNSAAVHLTIKERTAENLELELFGEASQETGGSYTGNDPFPANIQAGQTVLIPGGHVGISALVIKDSAATPATVAPTDYTVNPDSPLVTFLTIGTHVQPFHAFSYTYMDSTVVSILEVPTPEMCIVFDGRNLATPTEKIWCRLDRVSLGPAAKVTMKSGTDAGTGNTVAAYELAGSALIVPGKTSYGEYRSH